MYIAHVNKVASEVEFHLNFDLSIEPVEVGAKVFVSADNGHTGEVQTITEVVSTERIDPPGQFGWDQPFVCVTYKSKR